MYITKIFQNGNCQALHIPKELKTDKEEYFINKIGDVYIAYPIDDPWASVKEVVGTFSDDFMEDRNQPSF